MSGKILQFFVVVALYLLLAGCNSAVDDSGDNTEKQTGQTVDEFTITVKFSAALPDQTNLSAKLNINGQTYDMSFSNNYFVKALTNINTGTYPISININYDIGGTNLIVLASYEDTQFQIGTENNGLTISNIDMSFPDIDVDTYSNLIEIERNTNPVDPNSYPDDLPPIIADPRLTLSNGVSGILLSWVYASDETSTSLLYKAYYSTSNNIGSIDQAQANGTAYGSAVTSNSISVIGVPNLTNLYWNVLVTDETGNTNAYNTTEPISLFEVDSLFGSGAGAGLGFATYNNAGGGAYQDRGHDVAIDSMGRIYVAGQSSTTPSGTLTPKTATVLWRYTATGELDTDFNQQGFIVENPSNGWNVGTAVTVDSQNRVLLAGYSDDANSPTNVNLNVWRYDEFGNPDQSFNGGVASFNAVVTNNLKAQPFDIVTDSMDRVIVAGNLLAADSWDGVTVWRFSNTGILDTTFNSGAGFIYIRGTGKAASVTLDSANGIFVAREWVKSTDPIIMWHYDANGNLLTSYENQVADLIYIDHIQNDGSGKIIVSGTMNTQTTNVSDAILLRYIIGNGTALDTSFNNGLGYNRYAFPDGTINEVQFSLDSINQFYVFSSVRDATINASKLLVWQLNSNGVFNNAFNGGAGIYSYVRAGAYNVSLRSSATDSADRFVVSGTSDFGTKSDMTVWRFK